MKKLFFNVFVFVSFVSMAAKDGVEITDVKPTPFFPKVENGESLKQIVQISVKNTSTAMPFQVRISVEGQEAYYEEAVTLAKGDNTFEVHVLDVQSSTLIKFELLDSKKKVLAEKVTTWQPQKKWKVYYAAVSHQDLGFITYSQNLRRANRKGGIDIALELCKETDSWEEDAQFRWNVESSEPLIRQMSKQNYLVELIPSEVEGISWFAFLAPWNEFLYYPSEIPPQLAERILFIKMIK